MKGDEQLQTFLDAFARVPGLRSLLTDGLQHAIGRRVSPGERIHFPVLSRLPVVAAPPPTFSAIDVITLSVPSYGSGGRSGGPTTTLGYVNQLRAQLTADHERLVQDVILSGFPGARAALQGTAADPHTVGIQPVGPSLSLRDVLDAAQTQLQQARVPSGVSGIPINRVLEQLARVGNCQLGVCQLGVVAAPVTAFDPSLAVTFKHVSEAGKVHGSVQRVGALTLLELTLDLRQFEVLLRRAQLWIDLVHTELSVGCRLCGEPRDPDVEPVVLDVPVPPPPLPAHRSFQLKPEHWETARVTACSPTCATAYALRIEAQALARGHRSPTAVALERRHAERERAALRRQVVLNGAGAAPPSDSVSSHTEPRHEVWPRPPDPLVK